MALVGEIQKSTRHTQFLEGIEHGDALAYGQAVVEITVHDELGRGEVEGEAEGIPHPVCWTAFRVPDCAVLVVLDEPEFFGAVVGVSRGYAVVAD